MLARCELPVAAGLLRLIVLTRPVLAGGGLSGGQSADAVLQGGDELPDAELRFTFRLSLAVAVVVILLIGSVALGPNCPD